MSHEIDLNKMDEDYDVPRAKIEIIEANRPDNNDNWPEDKQWADGIVVKDSGNREEFSTGAVRDTQDNKGRYDLLQSRAIHLVSRQLQEGAKKYGDNNWRLGIPLGRFVDSALRHTFNILSGKTDEDHATAAAWNLLSFIETREMIREGFLPKELDNLWSGNSGKE